ncbi:YifB family Mg chelatase-like AAA ATPase [Acinetobacter bereziniae]|jgi:magnesium chelatase family protein|uniref:Mg chelatase-like protein n=1 Tax=Acinetobacter bereziniae LMG 1003 = CIP 70.12 TaxID=981324 RepID=N9CXT1_ACIBZ|nr:YifB family Mg chelatase-like AAA ATPase [Acinetobacter bereziniae]ENV90677.1 Mg chelatase-like protein [Acinetobacter bereziniae LMG 1003 = CIP 70.12]MDA3439640.1 YifB family Mg chelatase-like AAA ATPase [Acinetobacter bereziniae]MDG3556541.1 YifB family Mg chelatase-like AAA ATPase [Acinetobacter bereziniae]MDP6000859.1 YifB family Mg chelatase-like AAA ATPase [Acinetobacter bereziniae]QQC80783.1 YifB family Mg chelatase-like AAA ATPase [Acinetobacter bereziniae]
MSLAKIYTRGLLGLHAPLIEVEVHVSAGLPSLTIVGLAEAAVRESKDRVRSAIINSGFQFPTKRLTINLAPADLPKDGSRLDLPIALGILIATGQLPENVTDDFEFIGELALDGHLRPVTGTLTIAMACQLAKHQLMLPQENADEAAQLPEFKVFAAHHLKQVCDHFLNTQKIEVTSTQKSTLDKQYKFDLADVKGQLRPRRALEIAAAGGHSLLFKGPPGTGKTLLASRLPSILPALNPQENLEVASIYSIANTQHHFGQRPFRAPHHTASAIALVGGGSNPKPGEITLAHLGVLFLDELPEFDKKVLEVLRQPLESKEIIISRASRQITFPANFQLIAAMNPCPCGYAFNQDSRCQCSAESIKRYQSRISGPLLDRIDLHIDVPPLKAQELQDTTPVEDSATVRERVLQAFHFQIQRQGGLNHALSPKQLEKHVVLDETSQKMIEMAQQRLNLSARAYHRILRVSRTIADLAQSEQIQSTHLTEALSYRGTQS